jgi:hypothetical protein
MHQGQDLALHIPGRAGWELRLVVQGGLRIAEKIRQQHYLTWQIRPKLKATDALGLLWRAWLMK